MTPHQAQAQVPLPDEAAMTLVERLARKALPCNGYDCGMVDGRELHDDYYGCCGEQHLPAVEAVLREMVEACAELADENPFNGYGDKYIARNIRALLTEELPND